MLGALAKKLFGSSNDRRVKGYLPRVQAINALEPEIAKLSDEQLRARTAEFRKQLAEGTKLDDLLVPAFATGTASAGALAISVGGILLALRAFDEISVFFQQVSLAASSFEQIKDLLLAVGRPELESKIPLEMETGKVIMFEGGDGLWDRLAA